MKMSLMDSGMIVVSVGTILNDFTRMVITIIVSEENNVLNIRDITHNEFINTRVDVMDVNIVDSNYKDNSWIIIIPNFLDIRQRIIDADIVKTISLLNLSNNKILKISFSSINTKCLVSFYWCLISSWVNLVQVMVLIIRPKVDS